MRPFSLLVKPVSADCNLKCDYCFYLPKCSLYPDLKEHRISDAVIDQLLKSYMTTPQSIHSICWQGGEPTLMGTDFFSKVVDCQKKYGKPGAIVSNSVQTNGTLITEEMAKFFFEYKFLIGCSLDGPEKIHDQYRKRISGKGTFKAVLKGINNLQKHHVQFNILTLVSKANIGLANEIYHFFKRLGVRHHQYIPCVEFDTNGKLLPFAITAKQWGQFLIELFDQWYPKDIYSTTVRNFESVLSKKVDQVDNICMTSDNCCQYFVVEYNGDVYPCDFFVEEPFRLGNIMENSWEEMVNSPIYRKFGQQKKKYNTECNQCQFLEICNGDCLKHRMYAGNSPERLSWLCTGLKDFFLSTQPIFEALSDQIKADRLKA